MQGGNTGGRNHVRKTIVAGAVFKVQHAAPNALIWPRKKPTVKQPALL
jgi:hypothetical protein